MEELHLFAQVLLLSFFEIPSSADETSEHSLDESASIQNRLVVPFNFQHSPILLNVDSRLFLFFSVLLCLSK